MPRQSEAFTLIEALLSTVLLLVVLTQLASIQMAARQSLERVRQGGQGAEQWIRGANQFTTDCMHFQNPGFTGKGIPVIEVTQTTGDSTDGKLSFYVAEYLPAGSQDLRKLTYQLDDRKRLVRVSSPPPDAGSHLPDRTMVLAENVTGVKFGLFDGANYVQSWGNRLGLPQGLQLELETADGATTTLQHLFAGVLR
jgi:hypothetical protein